MAIVPVICGQCEAFFGFPILGGPGAVVVFEGSTAGPCPRCGGKGQILDGAYEFTETSLRLLTEPDVRLESLLAMRASVEEFWNRFQSDSTQSDPEELANQLAVHDSGLAAHLKKFVPKTLVEGQNYIMMLMMAISLAMCSQHSESINTEEDIDERFEPFIEQYLHEHLDKKQEPAEEPQGSPDIVDT